MGNPIYLVVSVFFSSSVVEQVAVNHLDVGSNPAWRVDGCRNYCNSFLWCSRFLRRKIPQFDFTTLSVVLFSSLLSAVLYYAFISLRLLPEIITVLKFRTKKLFKENSLSLNSVFLPNLFSYDVIVKRKK